MDQRAGALALEMQSGGTAHVIAAEQVYAHHRVEIGRCHAVEDRIAQDPRVVDHRVDPAKRCQRAVDNRRCRLRLGDAGGVGHRLAPSLANFVDHRLGRRGIAAFALERSADVVDHHRGTVCGQVQRRGPPDPAPGAGDDHHLSGHYRVHDAISGRRMMSDVVSSGTSEDRQEGITSLAIDCAVHPRPRCAIRIGRGWS